MSQRLAEAERTAGDLVRFGKITEVDLVAGRCVVTVGDLVSGPLPWFAGRAGPEGATWDPPSVGEQAVVLCAEGDLAAGLVVAGVYTDAILQQLGAFVGRPIFARTFRDGATVTYDPEAHELAAVLPEGGRVRLVAPGGLDLVGDLRVEGEIQATGDVTGEGVSLAGHVHGQVKAGTDKTGAPE